MRVDLVAVDLGRVDHVHERKPCHETADKLTLLSHDLVLCFATPVFSLATLLHEINSSAYVDKGCSEHIKCV